MKWLRRRLFVVGIGAFSLPSAVGFAHATDLGEAASLRRWLFCRRRLAAGSRYDHYVRSSPPNSGPGGIAEGADGNLWFVDTWPAAFDVGTQIFLEHRIPISGPKRIAADGSGNLRFTESSVDKIGKFTIVTQTFHEFRIPTSAQPLLELR